MPEPETAFAPRPAASGRPPVLEREPETVPESDRFASILPSPGSSLFKAPKGRIGMR